MVKKKTTGIENMTQMEMQSKEQRNRQGWNN